MQREEAVDGPYLRWLKDAQKKAGKAWDRVFDLDAGSAWAILRSLGVKPYEESGFPEDPRVTKVMVTHVTFDWLRPLPRSSDPMPGKVCKLPRDVDASDM